METSTSPHELSALAAVERIAAGALTVEALTRACLERIAQREPTIGAWESLDPEAALAQARRLDALPPAERGPLHGLVLGVKDLIETADQRTTFGSPIYAGYRPATDAAVVAQARAAGALVLGKTVTTEFAAYQPGKTANPRNPAHTPGGSSSGSAAAVADGMVPVAFGTQTAGSIIRPAAYCGVVGYKPSFGTLARAGVKPLAESLDTVGVLARSVEDAAFVVSVLGRRPDLRPPETGPAAAPARLGICRSWEWPAAAPETRAFFDRLTAGLARHGVATTEISLPESWQPLAEAQTDIMAFEAARNLAAEHLQHGAKLSDRVRGWLDTGAAVPPARYDEALEFADRCRTEFAAFFAGTGCDALLAPSAPGEAPAGLAATGDPVFNRVWTLLHVPGVQVPLATGPGGLPLGAQVIGPRGADAAVLRVAAWLQRVRLND